MTREEARKQLSSVAPAVVDKLFAEAQKLAGQPKARRHTEKSTAVYNAVVLPEMSAQVNSVKDAGRDPLLFTLVEQMVWCSRNLKPPVVVEYVSTRDAAEHDAKIAVELEKLRPKG